MSRTDSTPDAHVAIAPELQGEVRRTVAPDGASLNYRYWAAAEPGDAAVYLHGIAGHSLWFSSAARRLNEAGVTVYGADRRGSGVNRELGSGHIPHHRVVLRDIHHFVQLARAEHPGRKVFLIAGCWGAKPGVVYAARQQHLLDGLVLEAPALSVRVKLPLKDLLGVAGSLLTNQRRPFDIPLRPEMYTDNPEFRSFIASDPQRLLKVSARFYLETARLDRMAAAAPPSIRLPVLLLQGGHDQIVNVDGVRAWFGRLASADKTIVVYPEACHILEFEGQREPYLKDLLGWFAAHGSGQQSPVEAVAG